MAVDKERDRGAAVLGRDTGALHAGSGVSARELPAAVSPLLYGRLELTVRFDSPEEMFERLSDTYHPRASGPGRTVYRKQLFPDFSHKGQFIFDVSQSIRG
ncbi:hypothetical protein Y032_0034g2889 [Ancylostoma ceylanicum]|uniref:Uncharacterized protein n=1 Tax=Ancylostoma ceylanicum TaxID=53326 RepID=A0A016UM40_9BILA|nr:hypothetical protein Y032_0034g2889 [Ancylostoma ceylanicum]